MKPDTWQEGDIAYLKPHECFSEHDYRELIGSRFMHPGATGHPCIILKILPAAQVVITTVSAYGSGDHNHNRAPWLAKAAYSRDKKYFRLFEGSTPSSTALKPLSLAPGQQMPKPKASWLLIKNVYTVPLSVISRFTKPGKGVFLKMTPREPLRPQVGHRKFPILQLRVAISGGLTQQDRSCCVHHHTATRPTGGTRCRPRPQLEADDH
jgi:hypothetical protein